MLYIGLHKTGWFNRHPGLVKIAVFWVVAPGSLVKFTNVSEVLAPSIIRAMSRPDYRGTKYS
jgi:hypothetical protein